VAGDKTLITKLSAAEYVYDYKVAVPIYEALLMEVRRGV